MRYGLIGESLGHSFSKELHEQLSGIPYELIEIPRSGFDSFMRARDFDGINVTIPYKQMVIPYLDDLSPRAKAIGAVNTVVNRDGKLYGENTDFNGLEALIRRMRTDLSGLTVLIAGTGGTSLTATAVAKTLNAAQIIRASRSGRDGAMTYAEAYAACKEATFLINTTPAGMSPDLDGIAVDLSRLPTLRGVVDVVFNPLTTRLVLTARKMGIPAESGLYMLVAQAIYTQALFHDREAELSVTEDVYRTLHYEKRNLVLTGMPGSGKTLLAAILSERLERPLVDTDAMIVRQAGKPVIEIFAEHGEKYFRDLETSVIREVSRSGGQIISTGGGAVLREENVDALKQNGTIVFLDRPLSTLTPTDDRPLSDNREKLNALYDTRYPVYCGTADIRLPVEGTPEETASHLLKILLEG